MDFEDAKENIQPLAAGRNASILHASLRVESPQELLAQRRELEQAIHVYKGDDPLSPWYTYISWIEQSFPSGGKESGLEEVLTKCLSRFENEERYFQDRRMVKLYMKFIDSHQHPMECYQQLFNAGIGTMVADFYICWAYHYDLCGNTRKADEIFRRGITCRAQPLEELQEAHQHFGFTVAQRLMYQDDDEVKENTKRQFEERRLALTSLRGHRRKATVGSIRTGAVVKSYTPGTVQTDTSSVRQGNTRVQVFNDENATPNVSASIASTAETEQEISVSEDGKSVVRSIIDAARNQENLKEPGPWNKAHDKKKSGKLFGKTVKNTDLGFNIHEDIEMDCDDNNTFKKPSQPITIGDAQNYVKPFKYPKQFKNRNLPQKEWITPVTIENEPDPRTFPEYNKCFMYPRSNLEFQPEEYRAYCWFRKHGISNEFTAKRDRYWKSNDINVNIRQYPNFAKKSRPQKLDELDAYFEPEKKKELVVCFSKLYDTSAKVEYQWEELMANYLRRHDTILMDADMDETSCDINEGVQRRKSFFPTRRSMMHRRTITSAIKECTTMQSGPGAEFEETKGIPIKIVPGASIVLTKEIPKKSPDLNVFEDTTNSIPPTTAITAVGKANVNCQDEASDLEFKFKTSGSKANPTKLAIPFEIFEDTTSTIPAITATTTAGKINVVCQNEGGALESDLGFKFKTPALPVITPLSIGPSKNTTANKLGFDIYTDTSTSKTEDPPLTVGSCEGAVGGSIFDPEETCSTQTFNIYIKSQSVSTPKVPQKVALRQFGSVLKSIPNPPEILSSPESAPTVETNVEEQENVIKSPSEYSPLIPKQLSTILETSEHATTQGTHTTGGTKSSSNSTSDGEGEREVVTRLVIRHTDLEPLEEQSRESSTMPTEVIVSLENINIQSNTITTQSINMSKVNTLEICHDQPPSTTATTAPATPAQSRLELGSNAPAATSVAPATQLNFSIFEDERTEALKSKQPGNFTRIDEREDTAAGYAIRSLRFQEDKTETISKVLLNSRSLVKFQEDKTETLPKILIPSMVEFETEQTQTMPKLPKESSILLTLKNATANLDDSFEFFGQTPPGKSLLHPRYEVSAFKECMESRTPLSVAKRHCNVNTPDLMHLKPQKSIQKQDEPASTKNNLMNLKGPALFEDEIDKITSKQTKIPLSPPKTVETQKTYAPSVPIVHRVIARDSFLPDFSLIEETQQPQTSKAHMQTNEDANQKKSFLYSKSAYDLKSEKPTIGSVETQTQQEFVKRSEAERNDKMQEQRAKSNLGDSYFKDFSEIMDSQPIQSDNKWHRSATQSQMTEVQKPNNGNVSNSFLKDFSAIMESQPTEKDKEWLQKQSIASKTPAAANERKQESDSDKMELSKRNGEEKAKFDLGSSYLKDFSIIMESQPLQLETDRRQNKFSASKQQQQQLVKEKIEEESRQTESRKSLLKDSSLIMASQSAVNGSKLDSNKSFTTVITAATAADSMQNKPQMPQTSLHINNKSDLRSSYIKDFSFVPESQPIENAKHWPSNKSASSKLNPPIQINDSYLEEFSLAVEAPPPPIGSATKRPTEPSQKSTSVPAPTTTPAKPLLFLNSYMKDFSGFRVEPMSTNKDTSRLNFLNESKKVSDSKNSALNSNKEMKTNSTAQNPAKLLFLDNSMLSLHAKPPPTNRFSSEKSFELNAETAMFSTNISMIKNSTLLTMNEPNLLQAPTPIKEQSFHIKSEEVTCNRADDNSIQRQDFFKTPPMPVNKLPPVSPNAPNFLKQSCLAQENIANTSKGAVPKTRISTKASSHESKIPQPLSSIKQSTKSLTNIEIVDEPTDLDAVMDDADAEMSIYFKHTPKTPKIQQHIWNESSPSPKTPSQNVYVHREVDLNVTNQIIDNINVDPEVNPFNGYLQNAFLEQIEFSNYIEELPNCMMVGHVSRLHGAAKLKINDIEFEVTKLVGEGAYGVVYCGVGSKTGKKYALKQERPPNFWEYYICLEVHSRLNSDDLVCAFMSIDYALIGNNASVLISPFSVHGSLISICNKVKKHTLRNVDEYVVMLLTCELLSIIDHLHAINIIHADIKADNFILMKKLEYPCAQYALQLIDFGVSIDMKLFKPGQTFNYVHNEDAFKCVEMREKRPWTYQLDLYGLAGVIHVLLFGKFMDITQRANGTWMHKTHTPRYINRTLWDTIFQALLNVRDCETMPNLQNLRALIKEEIADKEKFVIRKVTEFNSALSA